MHFVTSGLTAEEHRALEDWPDGPRLFGHLLALDAPLRLPDLPAMVIVLIKWMIKPEEGAIKAFLHHWKTEALVQDWRGLVGEFLSEVGLEKYMTWDVRGAVVVGREKCS